MSIFSCFSVAIALLPVHKTLIFQQKHMQVATGTRDTFLLTSLFKSNTQQLMDDPILEELLSDDIFHALDSLLSSIKDDDKTIKGGSMSCKSPNID